jgi:hypothetical protein
MPSAWQQFLVFGASTPKSPPRSGAPDAPARKDRTHRSAIHLLVDLLECVCGRPRRSHHRHATSGCGWYRHGHGRYPSDATGLTAAGLRRSGSSAPWCPDGRRHVGHDLVHQGLVESRTEGRFGHFDGAERHLHLIPCHFPLSASLDRRTTITLPPVAPGTAPLTSSRLRSASTRTTSRFCAVRARTHVTGHFLALEHATRSLVLADGTRNAVRHGVTVGVLGTEVGA